MHQEQLQLHGEDMGASTEVGPWFRMRKGEPTQISKTEQNHFPTFQKKIGKLHCVDKP